MQGFSLEKMVGGVLADTRALMHKHAAAAPQEEPATPSGQVEDLGLADEGEKLASALEFVADEIEAGNFTDEDSDETSLEQVKQAYEIVAQVEADPKLKMKIAAAVGQLPKSPSMGKGIIPGKAPSTALANDRGSRPGGEGGRQQRATAKAPSQFQLPRSPKSVASIAPGHAPDALPTDLNDRPGGANYPEDGPIRTKSAASKVTAWGKIMKTAGEFSHDPAKDEGNKTAKISGGKSQGPLGKPKGAHAWGEGPRSTKPSEVMSSASAIKYTKAQAKQHMAGDLAKVLSHPAFSKKHDDVTSKNLSASGVSKLAVSGKQYRNARRRVSMEGLANRPHKSKTRGALVGGAIGAGVGALDAHVSGGSKRLGGAVGGALGAGTGALLQHAENKWTKHQGKLLDAHRRNMAERKGQSALKTAGRGGKALTALMVPHSVAANHDSGAGRAYRTVSENPKVTGALGAAGYGTLGALGGAGHAYLTDGDMRRGAAIGGTVGAAGGGLVGAGAAKLNQKLRKATNKQWDLKDGNEKKAAPDEAQIKLASLANAELLDRALRGEIDPGQLIKMADQGGGTMSGEGNVDAASGLTIQESGGGSTAPDDKAVAFREALDLTARHKGESNRPPTDVVGMPGGDTGVDSVTPSIPGY